MLYRNTDKNAVLAMEAARTGFYGEEAFGGYDDGDGLYTQRRCPCCGAEEPDVFYVNDNDECVGCGSCVYPSEMPWG